MPVSPSFYTPVTQLTDFATVAPAPLAVAQDRLKVLHLINGEHFSGAERVQQLLGKRLGKFGIEPVFASLKPDKFSKYCQLRGNQLLEFPMRRRIDLSVVKQIAAQAVDAEYRLLHAHTPRAALITALVARETGLPWIYHVHSPTARDSARGMVNQVNSLVERWAIGSATKVMTVSRSLRREMLSRGVGRSRLVVVPNGVPPIEPIDPYERVGASQWRIGMLALMRPRKGVEVALDALERLDARNLPIQLELIGGFETSEYEDKIRSLIASKRLGDKVQLRGFTTDVPAAIRRLDALLLPSLYGEGMPMVVLEALAAAVPVVATRVEGTPEVIRDGAEGFLAEPQDPGSLADTVMRLTASRERWCEASRCALERHRSQFTDTLMAERVAKCYRSILD